ncbi:MAG: SDR family NAD(P)-dependent oxidoreductase [Acidimicrobiia bacterium]|nr:SDR family NAD(P)-dependent oxidoreductase [Acidimicrobiia bacterium]
MNFGAQTTTDEVLDGVDLSGTQALVTGASAGLGQETARALAAHGASVIMAARDLDKGERAAAPVRAAATGGARIELRELDLASLESVRRFCDGVLADHDHLHLLVANAGVMAPPKGETVDGFETQFGTNHLGHFVLVNRLVPLLVAGAPSRIVNLSSGGHRFSDVDLDDPNFERQEYDAWVGYGRSKTANVLFAVELDRRLRDQGVRACAVHPGMIHTELARHLTEESINQLMAARGDRRIDAKEIPAGAATSVWAGVVADADAIGGHYCEDCAVSPVIAERGGSPGVMAYAVDPDTASALWARSEDLVGERFPES